MFDKKYDERQSVVSALPVNKNSSKKSKSLYVNDKDLDDFENLYKSKATNKEYQSKLL